MVVETVRLESKKHTLQERLEIYDFCEPEKQTLQGLRYNIPIYLKSLAHNLDKFKNNSYKATFTELAGIDTFVNYLDTSFKKAEELGFWNNKISKYFENYKSLKTIAAKVIELSNRC